MGFRVWKLDTELMSGYASKEVKAFSFVCFSNHPENSYFYHQLNMSASLLSMHKPKSLFTKNEF